MSWKCQAFYAFYNDCNADNWSVLTRALLPHAQWTAEMFFMHFSWPNGHWQKQFVNKRNQGSNSSPQLALQHRTFHLSKDRAMSTPCQLAKSPVNIPCHTVSSGCLCLTWACKLSPLFQAANYCCPRTSRRASFTHQTSSRNTNQWQEGWPQAQHTTGHLFLIRFWHLFVSKKTPNNAGRSQSSIKIIVLVIDQNQIIKLCLWH